MTGHLILLCMVLMAVTSMNRVRRGRFKLLAWLACCLPPCCKGKGGASTGGYTVFWSVHKLWMAVMALLWVHTFNAGRFWIWSLFPLLLMGVEKAIQARRTKEAIQILEVRQHDKDVMALKFCLQNGRKFKYTAGQYLYLQCEELDGGQRHPFTITSAPEDGFVSCHIRCRKGMDFTFALRKRLNPNGDTVVTPKAGESGAFPHKAPRKPPKPAKKPGGKRPSAAKLEEGRQALKAMRKKSRWPTIKIDGPYGSASEEVFLFKTLILVGAGIGVTPFASIMRSIALQMTLAKGLKRGGDQHVVLPDVHFFWICRSQVEFDSFKGLLKDDIRSQAKIRDQFHFNLYVSGELNLTDSGVQREMKEYSQWTQLYTGRPRWDRIFKEVSASCKQRLGTTTPTGEPLRRDIGVFLCGPSAIGKQLKKASRAHSDKVRESDQGGGTFFKFHMEHF